MRLLLLNYCYLYFKQQFQVVFMPTLQLKKRVSKAYPPQITSVNQQLALYSPLQQWLEVHSSTSLKDVVEIETPPQPLYMNSNDSELSFQSQNDLWTIEHQQFDLVSYTRKYSSQHSIITPTKRFKNHLINLTDTGILNMWNSTNMIKSRKQLQSNNPQSLGQISIKEKEESEEGESEGVQTWIQTGSMQKQYQNGFNLANLSICEEGFYTLHLIDYNNGMNRTRIGLSQLTDSGCDSHYFRGTMPSNINHLEAWNNSILAYGGDELLLLDRRSEAIVARLNQLRDSSVSCIKRRAENDNQIWICRDSYVMVMDLRKNGEIVDNTLDGGQDIETMDIIKEGNQQLFCLGSKFSGNVNFFFFQT